MVNVIPSDPPQGGTTPSKTGSSTKLTGKMGGVSLALTVLAFSAPLAVVSGFIPLTILFGGGGAPFGFIVATVVLLLFSVGYVTMTKHVPKPGAFYAFVSMGLGKTLGLGTAFLAIISYLLVLTGTYAFFGITVSALIESMNGPEIAWWIWSLLCWSAVSALGFFNIDLSAKVLTVAMGLEVLLVMIFNAFVLAKGGAEGLSMTPLMPSEFLKGDIGVTLLFAILVFMGFEATALFRDEVRNPDRVIPRATYGAVLFVGVLYTLTAYALVIAFGSDAVSVATETPAEMFPMAMAQFVSSTFVQITLVLVGTSIFAATLSIHNVIARYVYNLGYDRALPHSLARVHGKHGSPFLASNAVSVLSVAVIMIMVVLGLDEGLLYAQTVGLGSVGVLFLMALVSVSVVAWFAVRRRTLRESSFKVYVAPTLAALALSGVVVFAAINFHLVVGGDPGQYTWLLLPLVFVLLAGIGLATYFRVAKPDRYRNLGRSDASTLK